MADSGSVALATPKLIDAGTQTMEGGVFTTPTVDGFVIGLVVGCVVVLGLLNYRELIYSGVNTLLLSQVNPQF